MEMVHYFSPQQPLYGMEDNKQLMPTEPTMHCTLPFCIALCSMQLVGSVVVEHDLVLECNDA